MANADSTSGLEKVRVSVSKAQRFATDVLVRTGMSTDRATIVAGALILADLRGVDTHGLNRLPGYLDRIKAGVLEPEPDLAFEQKTPVCAYLDAKNTFGFIAASVAFDKGISMADVYGVGVVGIKNSGHYGMAATYLLQAIERGFGAFAFTNAARSMPAWGSKEALLGTSPFAVGLPGGSKGDFVLDMSPAVVARGTIRKAARRREEIPPGWALDAEGNMTTDPFKALEGVVLPIGGPKGSGLAMMMDIFGGLLTGSSFAGGVNDQHTDLDKPQGVGHWILVFKPEVFLDSKEAYLERMDTLMDAVRNSEKAAGVERIYTPGEIEAMRFQQSGEQGMELTRSEISALHNVAVEWGSTERLVW